MKASKLVFEFKKHVVSWIAFWLAVTWTIGAVSVVHAWSTVNLADVWGGKPLTSAIMQSVVNNLNELNGKISAPGSTADSASQSCKTILAANSSAGDGTYWIDPDGNGTGLRPFEVWCDMSGGGWTKVWVTNAYPFGLHTESERSEPFFYALSAAQINAIKSVSTEGKQDWQCQSLWIWLSYNYVGWDNSVNAVSASGLCWHSDNTSYTQGSGTNSALAKLPVREWRSSDCWDVTEACQYNVMPALFR